MTIVYASKSLFDAETKYTSIEIELLATVWTIKHFRTYLFDRPFNTITDHRPRPWLFFQKTRWLLITTLETKARQTQTRKILQARKEE